MKKRPFPKICKPRCQLLKPCQPLANGEVLRAPAGRRRGEQAGDASELGPSPSPRNLRYVTKDGKPSIVPQDVPPLQSAAVGVGGAFIISAYAMWRIESNKRKEKEHWIAKLAKRRRMRGTAMVMRGCRLERSSRVV